MSLENARMSSLGDKINENAKLQKDSEVEKEDVQEVKEKNTEVKEEDTEVKEENIEPQGIESSEVKVEEKINEEQNKDEK